MNTIDEFIKDKAPNTQKNYRWILNEYLKELDQDPETYITAKRDYKEDLKKWWNNHLDEVPTTRNTKLNIVKSYLEEYEILFPKKVWLKLRRMRKGRRPATMDRVPSQHEFKTILQHGTLKDKALFLFLGSSGMRIDEVLKLKPSMVRLDNDPPMVMIPGAISKTGDPRKTFISYEAKEYLLEWYKIREAYIEQAIAKTKHLCIKTRKNDTIFPFHYNLAWTRWAYLIKKAGLDDRDATTNRYLLHIHSLRKFFLSQMKLKIPTIIVEALAGHEEYLDSAYRRYTDQQMGDYYKQGMENVTIFQSVADTSELQKEMEQMKKEAEEMKAQILELRLEKLEQKN